jgi:hypothetical protein
MNKNLARARYNVTTDRWYVIVKTIEPIPIWNIRLKEIQAAIVTNQRSRFNSMIPGDRRDNVLKSILAAQQGRIYQMLVGAGHLFEQTTKATTKEYFFK